MPTRRLAAPGLAAIEVRGTTRAAFLLRATLAAGAVYGGGMVGPMVGRAVAQHPDLGFLEFGLVLEHVGAAFYERAPKEISDLGADAEELALELGEQELEHTDAVLRAIEDLGARPPERPEMRFGEAFASEDSFLRAAAELERTVVGALNGAIPTIDNHKLRASASGMVQAEARHLALVNSIRGASVVPDGAFTRPVPRRRARAALGRFIVS